MTRVLVVQDTTSTAEPLTVLLRSEGFTIAVASDGPHTMAELARHGADVVLLDLASRDRTNGTDVCRQLRARCTVGVIIISARDSEIDKVVGLEVGADDYITRPYWPASSSPGCGRWCAAGGSPVTATRRRWWPGRCRSTSGGTW